MLGPTREFGELGDDSIPLVITKINSESAGVSGGITVVDAEPMVLDADSILFHYERWETFRVPEDRVHGSMQSDGRDSVWLILSAEEHTKLKR